MITGTIDLDWKGKLALTQVKRAIVHGMNVNLAKCVQTVKPRTPVQTGILQGSMRMEPAREIEKNIVSGYFGSWDVNYAIFVEKGTIRMSGRHMMQSTADEVFPELGKNIRDSLKQRIKIK